MERENNQRKTNQCSVSTRRMNSNSNFHYTVCYILTNQNDFHQSIFHHLQNLFAGRIWPAGRTLEILI